MKFLKGKKGSQHARKALHYSRYLCCLVSVFMLFSVAFVFGAGNVVKVLVATGPEPDHLMAHVGEFESKTGIKVSFGVATREEREIRMMRELIEQRVNYDVVCLPGGTEYATFVTKGEYIPIENYMTKEEVSQFFARKLYTDPRTGKMAGIPQFSNNQMLFYRKDLLNDPKEKASFKKRYGRELKVPKTFKELYEVAEFFHRPPEMYGYFFGGVDWSWFCDFDYFLYGMGENYGDEHGNLTINTPGAVKAMDYLVKLSQFNPPGWESMTFFDGDNLMKEGKILMYQNWAYIWVTFFKEFPDKVGIAVPPGDVEPGAALGGFIALIPKKAPNPDLAAKFVKWMGGFEYQKELAIDLAGNLSSRLDVINDPDVNAAYPGIDQLKIASSHAHVGRCTWKQELSSGLFDIFFKVLKGETKIEDGMNYLQNERFAGRKAME